MYKPGCGITNLTMSWGHDEYMYRGIDKYIKYLFKKILIFSTISTASQQINPAWMRSSHHTVSFVLSVAYFPWLYTFRSTRRLSYYGLGEYIQVSIINLFTKAYLDINLWFEFRLYSRYDLYTKSENIPDIDKLWPYYQSLIDKYLPGVIQF